MFEIHRLKCITLFNLEKEIPFDDMKEMKKVIGSLTLTDINNWALEMKPHLEALINQRCDSLRLDVCTGQ